MRKLKKMGVGLLVAAALFFNLGATQSVYADETENAIYSILPDDPEWEQLGSVQNNPGQSDWHSNLDAELVRAYNVTLVTPGTCKYNCHSYAWYSTSTSNTVWIDSPNAYMTDGSYTQLLSGLGTFSGYVDSGAKVFYGTVYDSKHSAILTGTVSNVPLSNRTAISKWGKAGVFIHNVSNVPSEYMDSSSTVTVWH